MNLANITARVGDTIRALFRQYGSFSKLPPEAKALVRGHQQRPAAAPVVPSVALPAAAVPSLRAPDLALAAAVGMLGVGAAIAKAPTLAAFRDQLRRQLASRVAEKSAELGFPCTGLSIASAEPVVFPHAAGQPGGGDTASARLAIVAAELRCTVDDLRSKEPEDIRALVQQRIGSGAMESIAAVGMNIDDLPASRAADGFAGDDLEGIQEELKHTTDPIAAGRLAAKANALRDRQWGNAPARAGS